MYAVAVCTLSELASSTLLQDIMKSRDDLQPRMQKLRADADRISIAARDPEHSVRVNRLLQRMDVAWNEVSDMTRFVNSCCKVT